jgi:uncharacterized protein YodC (DUF2158 family)
MADQKFSNVTQVQLNSGGPVMTVSHYGQYRGELKYLCKWFDSKQELKESTFREAEIHAV